MSDFKCIFLDDERDFYDVFWVKYPTALNDENVKVVRNFFDFSKAVKEKLFKASDKKKALSELLISFDHDLGDYYHNNDFLNFSKFVSLMNKVCEKYKKGSLTDVFFYYFQYVDLNEEDFATFMQDNIIPVLNQIMGKLEKEEANSLLNLVDDFSKSSKLTSMLKDLKNQKGLQFENFFEVIDFAENFEKYKKGSELTGESCLQYLLDVLLDNVEYFQVKEGFNLENYFVHSQNSVKKPYMLGLLENFNKFIKG